MKKECFKAPFPYFGGKGRIAAQVWKYLGNPDHYLEPFFGSGAVLLQRPDWTPKMTETVNDKDGFICNVWRSIQFSPEKTAKVCDWPINHADLMVRKARLIREENYLLENLVKDDKWHDVELAGYWIWAASCWIGDGLNRPGQIPNLGNKGEGVHKTTAKIYDWFERLSNRLRRVRVVCGDWNRICGGNWQATYWKNAGFFFDPPYGHGDGKRSKVVYNQDSLDISQDVIKWCLKNGDNKKYRIVLAGYEGEHNELENHGWKKICWKAQGGYANIKRKTDSKVVGKENAKLERLWVSPYHIYKKRGGFFK